MLNHSMPRRAPYLIVAAAMALSLTGCITINKTDSVTKGGSGSVTSAAREVPSAKVLYEQMRKNATAATSVRIKGEVTSAGKKQTIDVAGARDGKITRALINDGTGQAELLTVGGSVYIKADTAYWTEHASAKAAKIAAGKYVKVPARIGVGALRVGALLDSAFKDLPLAGLLQGVDSTDVDGTPAYMLTDTIGAQNAQIYVSADGKARLLRIVSTKANPGTLDFSEWDAIAPIRPPPASQLIKIPGFS
jgi:hypothetical protein